MPQSKHITLSYRSNIKLQVHVTNVRRKIFTDRKRQPQKNTILYMQNCIQFVNPKKNKKKTKFSGFNKLIPKYQYIKINKPMHAS